MFTSGNGKILRERASLIFISQLYLFLLIPKRCTYIYDWLADGTARNFQPPYPWLGFEPMSAELHRPRTFWRMLYWLSYCARVSQWYFKAILPINKLNIASLKECHRMISAKGLHHTTYLASDDFHNRYFSYFEAPKRCFIPLYIADWGGALRKPCWHARDAREGFCCSRFRNHSTWTWS